MAQLYDIATGTSAQSKRWKNERVTWAKLVKRLKRAVVTPETYAQFLKADKEEQQRIKDVGGFVGGYLRGGRRHPQNVTHRQLVTLDLDFATPEFWDIFSLSYGWAAVLHGTHKNGPDLHRYRLVLPLDREVKADEYEAIARKIAGLLNIELFDKTTFQVNRLMFWPSVSIDNEYYFQEQQGEPVSADYILSLYRDWTDSTEWPTSSAEFKAIRDKAAKQEDPTEKSGWIGAFCRAYNIHEVIEKYLSEVYEVCDDPNRYTYTLGSTSAGAIAYDDLFLYSHHGTDPTSGMLCNAFDLVRVHKYGHLDDEQYKKGSSAPSFKKMEALIRKDKNVVKLLSEERLRDAAYEFSEGLEGEMPEEVEPIDEKEAIEQARSKDLKITIKPKTDKNWLEKLQLDGRGALLSSAHNLNLILANDPKLNRLFAYNEFDGNRYLATSPPWRKISHPEKMEDRDYSGLRNYLDAFYSISNSGKVDDALALVFSKNTFHPIREYLFSLKWDKKPRVDHLLADYMGAEDNVYTREAIRKTLVGAVARVLNPGIKFDMVLILAGPQGKGKSTFIRKLALDKWFSDSFATVQGKEAFEQLQGAWIIEVAELSAFKRSESEVIKQYFSKQIDKFRPAYGRTVQDFPRQCIFIGTSNFDDFLKDPTGNRRYNPVGVKPDEALFSVFSDELDKAMSQVWAEAMDMYLSGEDLFLGEEAARIALAEQERYSESDGRKGLILDYLEMLLPDDWNKRDTYDRRIYFETPSAKREGKKRRKFVCAAEIWCECLGMDKNAFNSRNTREINDLMRQVKGWKATKNVKIFHGYGPQRYYSREY